MKAYRLSNIPFLLPLYITLRSVCAAVGGVTILTAFSLLWLGYLGSLVFIVSEAVIIALTATLLGFVVKVFWVLKTRVGEPIKPDVGTTYEIDDNGDVRYNPESVLADLKKQKFSSERWKDLASKYQGRKYKGHGWNAVRVYCLTQAQKNDFEIIDNRY